MTSRLFVTVCGAALCAVVVSCEGGSDTSVSPQDAASAVDSGGTAGDLGAVGMPDSDVVAAVEDTAVLGDDASTGPVGELDVAPGDDTLVPVAPPKKAELPLLSPSVKSVTPKALLPAAMKPGDPGEPAVFDLAAEFKTRLFEPGPTYLFGILEDIDGRLGFINTDKGETRPCLSAEPVEYMITPAGGAVPMYVQCFTWIGPPGETDSFLQFGKKDGVTYLYTAVGASAVAAVVTPIPDTPERFTIDAWVTVGRLNALGGCGDGSFSGCSYAIMHLRADPAAGTFEMAVAGLGIGFCGAQFHGDATAVLFTGSADGPECAAPASVCASSVDLSASTDCAEMTFELPALGRNEVTAGPHPMPASKYPDTPNITLDGTPTDSVNFGPSTPTEGALDFTQTVEPEPSAQP